MNQSELENYSVLHEKVEAGITEARQEIEETKAELVEAKRVRKNRMEYDALAKVILTHPDRDSSAQRIEQLKLEQKQLEERELKLEQKLDIRKKQFHVLVSSIHQMQDLLANDEDRQTGESFHYYSAKYFQNLTCSKQKLEKYSFIFCQNIFLVNLFSSNTDSYQYFNDF